MCCFTYRATSRGRACQYWPLYSVATCLQEILVILHRIFICPDLVLAEIHVIGVGDDQGHPAFFRDPAQLLFPDIDALPHEHKQGEVLRQRVRELDITGMVGLCGGHFDRLSDRRLWDPEGNMVFNASGCGSKGSVSNVDES